MFLHINKEVTSELTSKFSLISRAFDRNNGD